MCLGADIEIVIPEQDEMRLRPGTTIRRATQKTNLSQFGPDIPASISIEGEARIKSGADNLRIKLIHGDVLMLSGGNRKVCPYYVVWYGLRVTVRPDNCGPITVRCPYVYAIFYIDAVYIDVS